MLRDKLRRDTAPVPIYQLSATETNSRPLSKLVPRNTYGSIELLPWLAKTRAIPSSPPGQIPSKEPGLVAGWLRRVTLTYFIAVPLGVINGSVINSCHDFFSNRLPWPHCGKIPWSILDLTISITWSSWLLNNCRNCPRFCKLYLYLMNNFNF